MNEFFLNITPPRTTAQQQKTTVVNGKPRRYDPPSLKAAKKLLLTALAGHKPREPYAGAVKLTVRWQYSRGGARRGTRLPGRIPITSKSCSRTA